MYSRSSRAGVTLTELLVVLVIIGILATIAVPAYIGHAETARKNRAKLEVQSLADAEEACAIHHGFYVPLQLLNDLQGSGITSAQNNQNAIGLENGVKVIDPAKLVSQLTTQPTIGGPDTRIADMVRNWQGPFMNFQEFVKLTDQTDHPLDPWKRVYRFYTPAGVVGPIPNAGGEDPDYTSLAQGTITPPTVFDRYAIVSLGPDGILQNLDDATSDDVIYYFGSPRVETSYTP